MSENEKKKLLEIKDLKIYYPIKGKRDAEGKPAYVKAVDGVTFDVYENETFGLVGESGCGKSTTGRTVVRLNKPTAGSVTFEGHDLFAKMNRQQNMNLTQKIQIIYQDPYSSLDPRFTVGRCWGRFRFLTRIFPQCRTCWKAMCRAPSTRRRAAASTRAATAAARNAPRRSRS